jgi:hypothetical protein
MLSLITINCFSQTEIQRVEIKTDKDCLYVEFDKPDRAEIRKQSAVTWTGGCLENYIDGKGTLTIKPIDGQNQVFTTTYKNGLENGEGISTSEGPKGKSKFIGAWKDGFRVKGTHEVEPVGGIPFKYVGEFSNGKYNGYGKFEKGRYIYEGYFKDGLPDGKGKRTFENGVQEEGIFVKSFLEKGVRKFKDGSTLEGEFVKGIATGKLILKFANGDTYEGDFKNNNRDGYGIYKFASGNKYEGNLVENKFQGQGKFTFANGVIMIGKFVNNQFDNGKKIYPSGIIDEGYFSNSDLTGKGKRIYSNGGFREGTFIEGKLEGAGKDTLSNGTILEGQYIGDVLTGKHKLTYPNGDVAEVDSFQNNKADGMVTYTKPNGDKWYQEWKDGKKISETPASTNSKPVTEMPRKDIQIDDERKKLEEERYQLAEERRKLEEEKRRYNSKPSVNNVQDNKRQKCFSLGLVPDSNDFMRCMK